MPRVTSLRGKKFCLNTGLRDLFLLYYLYIGQIQISECQRDGTHKIFAPKHLVSKGEIHLVHVYISVIRKLNLRIIFYIYLTIFKSVSII